MNTQQHDRNATGRDEEGRLAWADRLSRASASCCSALASLVERTADLEVVSAAASDAVAALSRSASRVCCSLPACRSASCSLTQTVWLCPTDPSLGFRELSHA